MNYESILTYARMLCGIGRPIDGFVMLQAAFDDSGTHNGSEVLVVAGVIGDEHQFLKLEKDWVALLRAPLGGTKPPLKNFGISECRARRDAFIGYSEAESDALTHDFRAIIAASGVKTLAHTVDIVAWREIIDRWGIDKQIGSAEAFCLTHCVDKALKYMRAYTTEQKIAVFYDKGQINLFPERSAMILRSDPAVHSLSFVEVASFAPMQAADTVAGEANWFGQEFLKHGPEAHARPHFQHYLKLIEGAGYILDRDKIHEIAASVIRSSRS